MKRRSARRARPAEQLQALLAAAGVAFFIGSSLFALQQPTKYVQANSLTNWISAMEAGRKPLSGNGLTLYSVDAAFACRRPSRSRSRTSGCPCLAEIHEKLSWAVVQPRRVVWPVAAGGRPLRRAPSRR